MVSVGEDNRNVINYFTRFLFLVNLFVLFRLEVLFELSQGFQTFEDLFGLIAGQRSLSHFVDLNFELVQGVEHRVGIHNEVEGMKNFIFCLLFAYKLERRSRSPSMNLRVV